MRKEHKKMYKSGKRWVTALLTATTLGIVGVSIADNPTVHADTPSTNSNSNNDSNASANSSSVSSVSNDASANANSSSNSSVSNDASASASASASSSSNSSVSNDASASSVNNDSSSTGSDIATSSSSSVVSIITTTNPSSSNDNDINTVKGYLDYSNPASAAYMYIYGQFNNYPYVHNTDETKSGMVSLKVVGNHTVYPQSITLKNDGATGTQQYLAYQNDSNNNSPISSISNVTYTYNGGDPTSISPNEYKINNDYPNNSSTPQFYYGENVNNPSSTYIAFNNDIINNSGFNFNNIGDSLQYNFDVNFNDKFNGVNSTNSDGSPFFGVGGGGRLHREVTSVPSIQVNYFDNSGKVINSSQYFAPEDDSYTNIISAGKNFRTYVPTIYNSDGSSSYTYDHYTTASNYKVDQNGYVTPLNDDSGTDGANLNIKNGLINGTFNSVKTASDSISNVDLVSHDWMTNIINIYYGTTPSASSSSSSSANSSSAPSSAGSSANSSSTPSSASSSANSSSTPSSASSSANSSSAPSSASSSANSSSTPSSASSSANSSSAPSSASSSANSSSAPSSASSSASAQSIASSSDSSFKYADSVNHSVLSSASSAASSASSTASSASSKSSVASSAAVKYYKMYNNKTTLVKKNHKIHIFIEPKFAPANDKGSVHDQYVVSRKLKNGDISHEQEITLTQYRSMLVASGKKSISKKGLAKAYTKHKHLNGIQRNKEDKTTFNATVKKANGETLINLNDQYNGFKPLTKDQKRVKDTQDIRVKIHNKH